MTHPDNVEISVRLCAVLEGKSRARLSRKMEVGLDSITKWCAGSRPFPVWALARLCHAIRDPYVLSVMVNAAAAGLVVTSADYKNGDDPIRHAFEIMEELGETIKDISHAAKDGTIDDEEKKHLHKRYESAIAQLRKAQGALGKKKS